MLFPSFARACRGVAAGAAAAAVAGLVTGCSPATGRPAVRAPAPLSTPVGLDARVRRAPLTGAGAPLPVATPGGPPPAQPAPPAPAGPSHRDYLTSDNGALNTAVSLYGDCAGQTPLTHATAAIDTCIQDRIYFVGHNPGVFTPLMSMGVGSVVTYWDDAGVPHRARIFAVFDWARTSGTPARTPGATMEFQTCANADGSILRNLEAEPV